MGALQLASDASPTGQSGCKGKGGLKKAQLDAAGLTKDKLQCAWQNHSGELGDGKGHGGTTLPRNPAWLSCVAQMAVHCWLRSYSLVS